jgi:hypothetical protein
LKKKIIPTDILVEDSSKFDDLLTELIEEIESSDVEDTAKILLDNLIANFKEFKDIRYIKASNIMALTNLINTISEIPNKKVNTIKNILDLKLKKENLKVKKEESKNTDALSKSVEHLGTILDKLDELGINPVIDKEKKEKASSLIDAAVKEGD